MGKNGSKEKSCMEPSMLLFQKPAWLDENMACGFKQEVAVLKTFRMILGKPFLLLGDWGAKRNVVAFQAAALLMATCC